MSNTIHSALWPLEQGLQTFMANEGKRPVNIPNKTDPLGPPNSFLYPGHPDPLRNAEGKIRQFGTFDSLTTAASIAPTVHQRALTSNGYMRPVQRAAGYTSGIPVVPRPDVDAHNTKWATESDRKRLPGEGHTGTIATTHMPDGRLAFDDTHFQQHVFTTLDRSLKLGQKDDHGAGTMYKK